jgi:hypothetical protein
VGELKRSAAVAVIYSRLLPKSTIYYANLTDNCAPRDGIDLRAPAFTHGQFYVAVSRTSSTAGLHILLTN